MNFSEMSTAAFIDLVASDAPAPGGGSVAAMIGATGAALTTMVAGLTLGKEKYEAVKPVMEQVIAEGTALRKQLEDAAQKDTDAFNEVAKVFDMPKNTDEEKAARKAAMAAGLKACTLSPLYIMELSGKVLELTEKVLPEYNTNAASDLGVSAISLRTAIQGAWMNVLINLGSIKDEEFVATNSARGTEILNRAEASADKIYKTVLASL